ncbi:MAG: transglutaminase-like domain-containing protein [Roseimicrobium sp.]
MQTATSDLQHLLKLLDDDSPVVRQAVRAKLGAMRREIPEHLLALGEPLDEAQQRLLSDILAPVCREELEETWLVWRWLATPEAQLEEALGRLSAFLSGWQAQASDLSRKLDRLAEKAQREGMGDHARALASFLFGGRGRQARLRGNGGDYYSAQNSNLLWVLANGVGNPISLACIFLLVGRRLGIRIQGCNFPQHFLARVEDGGELWLVDCFNRGRFMLAQDVAKHHPAMNPAVEEVIYQAAAVEAIIARVLRNLDDAFVRSDNLSQRKVVRRLLLRLMEAGDQEA